MRTSSLFGHVVEVLDIIRSGARPADTVVREFFRARHYLGSSDRRYIAARTYDVLRHATLLSVHSTEALKSIGGAAPTMPLRSIILAVAYEVRCGTMQQSSRDLLPDVAGIWRVFVPGVDCGAFVDAVGRSELPAWAQADDEHGLSVEHSIPSFVIRDWLRRYGKDETGALCSATNGTAPITIRVNTLKCGRDECREALLREGIAAQLTKISPAGLTLAKRINAQGSHSFKQGWFEMQDEGSQVLSFLTDVRPGMTVIDACAGAGGKSLHLAAMMENSGKLIAMDVDSRKLDQLGERSRRAGVTIVEAIVCPVDAAPKVMEEIRADVVLVDAPCSGTGVFRRSPWLKLGLTENAVHGLAHAQGLLLDRYAHAVKPGGRLVYTTCSLLAEENMDVVDNFLAGHPAFALVPARVACVRNGVAVDAAGEVLELLPHRTTTDGYFAAVLVRAESGGPLQRSTNTQ